MNGAMLGIFNNPFHSFAVEAGGFNGDELATLLAAGEMPKVIASEKVLNIWLGSQALGRVMSDAGELPVGEWNGSEESLSVAPAHADAGRGLKRYAFKNAPYHSSLHIVLNGSQTERWYGQIHAHDDVNELNVILPSNEGMAYKVRAVAIQQILVECQTIREPTALWFPAGVSHCATALEGSGAFFVIRFPYTDIVE